MLLLKYFLSEKNLSNAYLGGLNAYGMSLLLIAFFETYKGSLINQTNLLIRFCEFLAADFNPNEIQVWVNNQPFSSRAEFDLF